jgi:hypothetical protein
MRIHSFLLIACLLLGQQATAGQTPPATVPPPSVEFVDITQQAGIKFDIQRLATGPKYLVETMGGGGGFLDYNGDGLLDIYLVSYTQTPQPTGTQKPHDVLYRNNGDGTFTDVTQKAGIANSMLGMGLSVADYNNDGWPDIYITGYEESKLYRNNGNGTFTDVTEKAGVGNKRWGTGAAFFDYDNDGRLDLYVVNYLDMSGELPCVEIDRRPYCTISKFKGTSGVMFRNNGNGTFTDVTQKVGLVNPEGKGLGVVALDYNNDGWMDFFQANDGAANFLYRNNGNRTFTEVALEAEVALDTAGKARGGMGVDAEDLDQNGYLDIFVANFINETNALFRNDGGDRFTETTYEMGLGTISLPMSGFGSLFFDYNNDGLVDLFVLNGHPFEQVQKVLSNITYAEPPFLFENTGKAFREVAGGRGAALKKMYPGRGLATGDIDNDGDADLLLISVGHPPLLLRNDGGNKNRWLGVKLIGAESNRDAIGAKVYLTTGGTRRWKQLLGGRSYCSASDARLLFGLGERDKIDLLEVRWPSGQTTRIANPAVNHYQNIEEGNKTSGPAK